MRTRDRAIRAEQRRVTRLERLWALTRVAPTTSSPARCLIALWGSQTR